MTSSTLQMDPKKPVRRVGAKPPPDRAQKAIGCLSLKNPFRSLVPFRRISGFQLFNFVQPFTFNIALSCRKHCIAFVEWKPFDYFILLTIMVSVIIIVVVVIIFMSLLLNIINTKILKKVFFLLTISQSLKSVEWWAGGHASLRGSKFAFKFVFLSILSLSPSLSRHNQCIWIVLRYFFEKLAGFSSCHFCW